MKLTLFSLLTAAVLTVQSIAGTIPSLPETMYLNSALTPSVPTSREQRIKHFRLDKNHVAIGGYDPVSYFKSSGPKKGKAGLAYDFDGVIYWFANAKNLNEFKTNPVQFEPVWGGWCGHAMAVRGEKVEINPVCYKIVNGRNVLFYKTFYANALTNWEKEIKKTPEQDLMVKGDDFWGKAFSK
ncbi:MAG: YHS domain-containing (seleno)protein [Saprospiraceae bacterium]